QDDRNRLNIIRRYIKKWLDKALKLRDRENKLKTAVDTIDKRDKINTIDTVNDATVTKNVLKTIPVARAYDFIKRIKLIYQYSKLGKDLVDSHDEIDKINKNLLITKLYKVYYYKLLDLLFNNLSKLSDKYRLLHMMYFFKKLRFINLLLKAGTSNREVKGDLEPKQTKLNFKGKSTLKTKVPEDKSIAKMIIPSFVKHLNDKILDKKKWAWDNLLDKYRACKFADLYKKWSNQTILPPKRDLVDLLKAEYSYMNGLGAKNCDLFKLLRRYWIKLVCDSMVAPSRVYRLLYLIKMVMMHKTIAYQRFIRELVRKWRFSSFIFAISRRKLELMYKNLHVSYLQMANEIFGDKGGSNASLTKEFERLSNTMGLFTNEDFSASVESNYCERINKKYVFQPMQILLEKEGHTQFFSSGIEIEDSGENNEDYYVDRELDGETIGKYKQDTNKSKSSSFGKK
ncbi:MAG: hypothetical protein MJ203_06040, partial [archaeon]|nr:hypothetical protein [archaeon]